MVNYGEHFDRVMAVSVKRFTWDDSYVYCECTAPDDTPLLNVLGWKVGRAFTNGMKEI